MRNIQKRVGNSKRNSGGLKKDRRPIEVKYVESEEESRDTIFTLIQELIPLGLLAVNDVLQEEVTRLAGERYSREGGLRDLVRWGSQEGSVYLQDMKVKVDVPRVRNRLTQREVPLESYQKLQEPSAGDTNLLSKILLGISCQR